MAPDGWFLTADERGNPHSRLPASCVGNLVRPLVHGAEYFARLAAEVDALRAGDHVFFTDWRGDPDERQPRRRAAPRRPAAGHHVPPLR